MPSSVRSSIPPKSGGAGAPADALPASMLAWLVNAATLHWTSITGAVIRSSSGRARASQSGRGRCIASRAACSSRRKSVAVTLSCSVNVSPMGQSRVPAG